MQGHYNNTDYAVLQCKCIRSRDVDNEEDLLAKLEILHLSQYFLDSFYKRGKEEGVHNLPKMKWNITGAFIGKLTQKLADAPNNGEEDSRSLVFSCFMVLPLLPIGALCSEIKLSGNAEVGVNNDSLGSAIDAYAHHVAVDLMYEMIISNIQGIVTPDRSIVFFDLQSHITNGDSGYWDHGKPAITEFLELHKRNKFCKALGLDAEVPPLSLSNTIRKGPLHISFD
ncbi:hypothetical protein EDB19DRAFT_1904184 [Suillus lakei]|nr:hypothetical protein EDB19DRAFT_1904184 [Suillus lakei]